LRDEVADRHDTDKIHLLFNNAGIGGGSIIAHGRDEWERTFNVCWGGVYNWCRSCSSGAGTTRICTSFPPSSYARSSGTARVHALEAGHWRQIDAAEETARIMLGS
jgi:NAD(P)-dependent dehydrogenase (short-subunit alcohol dehydrogenase family)